MEIPEWLKEKSTVGAGITLPSVKRPKERFLDKTIRHVISFTNDIMFNEKVSSRRGLLQIIEPRLKIGSLVILIILLSLQRSIHGIAIFFITILFLALLSKIPLSLFLKRIIPIMLFTTFIALPASLNLIVKGDSLLNIYEFDRAHQIGPIEIPAVISLTRQGITSASMLILRVATSVSIIFLITLTTPPNSLIRAFTYFIPGSLKSIVSISYRYIFFLIRRVEEFLIAYKSRTITTIKTATKHRWIASRIGLLFSLSIKLSQDLEKAMDSRGYNYKFKVQSSKFKVSELSKIDIVWLIFSVTFMGVMLWKSLN